MTCELSSKSLRDLRDQWAAEAEAPNLAPAARAHALAKAAEYQHRLHRAEVKERVVAETERPRFRLFGITWGKT